MTNFIVDLKFNHALLQQFRAFLDQREAKLADELTLTIIPSPGELGKVHLHGSGHMKLTQALQTLTTLIRDLNEDQIPPDKGYSAIGVVNRALWSYVEVLDGAVYELIQQLQQTDIQSWDQHFFEVVLAFKELLVHRIEDTIWLYKRLEDLFLTYRAVCRKRKNFWIVFGRVVSYFSSLLDGTLFKHLVRAEENLNRAYKSFSTGFKSYQAMCVIAEEKSLKFKDFIIFQQLSFNHQSQLLALFRLLRIREENIRQKLLDQAYIDQAIKNLGKSTLFGLYFRDFFKHLKEQFFNISRQWQEKHEKNIEIPLMDLKRELYLL